MLTVFCLVRKLFTSAVYLKNPDPAAGELRLTFDSQHKIHRDLIAKLREVRPRLTLQIFQSSLVLLLISNHAGISSGQVGPSQCDFWPFTPPSYPAMATDSTGNVYVNGNSKVYKLSPAGTILAQWGTPGSQADEIGSDLIQGQVQAIKIEGCELPSSPERDIHSLMLENRIKGSGPRPECIEHCTEPLVGGIGAALTAAGIEGDDHDLWLSRPIIGTYPSWLGYINFGGFDW